MRIGQVAALVGVSTRTIRHYHHMGVLPEPEREPNGYRRYSVQDAVLLTRVRRLTALGMSLEEAADSLAGDQGTDLGEILRELDKGLARQETEIHEARQRIAKLRKRARTSDDLLAPPLLGEFAEEVAAAGASGPSAQLDAQLLSLLPDDEAARVLPGFLPDPSDRESREAMRQLYEQMDALAGAGPDDPRVSELAATIVDSIPANMRAEIPQMLATSDSEPITDAIFSQLSPGQVAVVRQVMERLGKA